MKDNTYERQVLQDDMRSSFYIDMATAKGGHARFPSSTSPPL